MSVVYPISTATEFTEVMLRETGTAITRPRDRDRRRNKWPTRLPTRSRRPVPEVYPYTKSRGLVLLNAIAPGFCDRLVKRYGRQPIAATGASAGSRSHE